jgi:hypothetical protein
MLSVPDIHQPTPIFSESASSEFGDQCPLATRWRTFHGLPGAVRGTST